jgi:uncharacterized phage protein gp47/JayE
MAYETPGLSTLISRVTDDIATRVQDTSARIRYSLPWTVARVVAGTVYDLYGFAGYIADQIIPSTATDEYLDEHGNTWGVTRTEPTEASGFALVQGTIGGTLPAGSTMTREDGAEYSTPFPVVYTHTVEVVPIDADESGAAGNADGGTTLTLASPPAGFTASAYAVTSDGMTGGTGSTKATGYFTVSGTIGATLPAGATFRRLDGIEYTSDDALTFGGTGYRVVAATASLNGTNGNAAAGTYAEIITPPAGIDADAQVTADGISGGADAQSDTLYRTAILDRIQQPPHGGAAADYIAWAKETPGVRVSDVWVFGYPTTAPGSVEVYFTVEDTGAGVIPAAGQIDAVGDYIDGVRPVTAAVTVDAPGVVTVDLTITLHTLTGYTTADVQDAVEAELSARFAEHDLSSSASYLRNSRIRDAINEAAGVDWYTLDAVAGGAGTDDVSLGAYEMPTLGTVTWS